MFWNCTGSCYASTPKQFHSRNAPKYFINGITSLTTSEYIRVKSRIFASLKIANFLLRSRPIWTNTWRFMWEEKDTPAVCVNEVSIQISTSKVTSKCTRKFKINFKYKWWKHLKLNNCWWKAPTQPSNHTKNRIFYLCRRFTISDKLVKLILI